MYKESYYGICVFVTIILTSWCIYEYMLDPEVSNIMLRKFHETPDDIQPSITLCDKDPFKQSGYSGTKDDFQKFLFKYQNYILGNANYGYSAEVLLKSQKIDYDNVTSSLNDILDLITFEILSNIDEAFYVEYSAKENFLVADKNKGIMKTKSYLPPPVMESLEHISVYTSARNGNFKCYTIDIPWIKGVPIKKVEIKMNATFASLGDRYIALGKYFIMLTYPYQTLQVPPGKHIYLNKHHLSADCYKFKLITGAMEVYHRRDKSEKSCNADWKNHDIRFMKYVMEKSGCNPKHWNIKSNIELCKSVEQYQKVVKNFLEIGAFMPPCRSIELFSIETKGHNPGHRCPTRNPYFNLEIYLDKEMFYKEISEVRAYTFQSLVEMQVNDE